MGEQDRPVYCSRCGSIAQAGDRFCGVCGEEITSDAQDARLAQLERLVQLREAGILDDEELRAEKARILRADSDGMATAPGPTTSS